MIRTGSRFGLGFGLGPTFRPLPGPVPPAGRFRRGRVPVTTAASAAVIRCPLLMSHPWPEPWLHPSSGSTPGLALSLSWAPALLSSVPFSCPSQFSYPVLGLSPATTVPFHPQPCHSPVPLQACPTPGPPTRRFPHVCLLLLCYVTAWNLFGRRACDVH